MRDMTTLEEIGLQEVSRKTHIEMKTLQYMVNKEFDKLSRVNTLGFLKILSREFHLDVQEWQREFEAYWKETKEEDDSKESTFVLNAPPSPFRPLRWVVVVALILGVGLWYGDAWNHVRVYFEKESEPVVVPLVLAPAVEEAKESLEAIEKLPEQEVGLVESGVAVDTNQTLEQEAPVATAEASEEPLVQTAPLQQAPKQARIEPNVNIWVGIVYLDTKRRASHLTSSPIDLDLSREQIITTGHGNFSLTEGEERHAYVSQMPKRFHVKEGVIREISQQEFVTLNGGSAW